MFNGFYNLNLLYSLKVYMYDQKIKNIFFKEFE